MERTGLLLSEQAASKPGNDNQMGSAVRGPAFAGHETDSGNQNTSGSNIDVAGYHHLNFVDWPEVGSLDLLGGFTDSWLEDIVSHGLGNDQEQAVFGVYGTPTAGPNNSASG